jgi:nucleoside-diphosphate-sugar epimerase
MNVLVTGATGRIGSRFVSRHLRRETNVSVLARSAASGERFMALGACVVVGDIGDLLTLPPALEAVAAQFRSQDQEVIQTTNEAGTVALAQACGKAGVERFVFASTSLVYGDFDYGRPARESDEPLPQGTYPQSLLAAEQYLLGLNRDNQLDVRILRLLRRCNGECAGPADEYPIFQIHWNLRGVGRSVGLRV